MQQNEHKTSRIPTIIKEFLYILIYKLQYNEQQELGDKINEQQYLQRDKVLYCFLTVILH